MEYLIIDPSTRKITIPKSEQLFGVYGESNIERKYFKCPKIVGDNVDLSDCYIFVNYYTAKGLPGKYTVKDVKVDGENITFSWELKQHIFDANEDTSIYFAVEAKNKDKVEVFRTSPATGKAKETIDTDTEIEDTYADVILDLISRVDTLEKEPISEEQIEKSVKSYLEKNPIEETDPTVPAWAKEEEKPTYTAEEVGALPSTTEIPKNLFDLQDDSEHRTVTDTEKQSWSNKSDFDGNYESLTGKPTIPTVPEWAKAEEKPVYTASEVGALPSTTVIPSKLSELTADDEHETVTKEEKQAWNAKSDFSGEYRDLQGKPELAEWVLQSEKPTYTASEVGALPSTTEIPKNLSDLGEDTTHRTVTDEEKQSWDNKSDFSGNYGDLRGKPTIPTVPTTLPNPQDLTITYGGQTYTYDGSEAVAITIETGSIERIEKLDTDTTVTLEPNKLYVFPEMESLTYIIGEGTGEVHFFFRSGATATRVVHPTGVNIGSFSVDANKIYEVSILEGLLTSQNWSVN